MSTPYLVLVIAGAGALALVALSKGASPRRVLLAVGAGVALVALAFGSWFVMSPVLGEEGAFSASLFLYVIIALVAGMSIGIARIRRRTKEPPGRSPFDFS